MDYSLRPGHVMWDLVWINVQRCKNSGGSQTSPDTVFIKLILYLC
jgi:hypothetical protein